MVLSVLDIQIGPMDMVADAGQLLLTTVHLIARLIG